MLDASDQMTKATLDVFTSMMGLPIEEGALDEVPSNPARTQIVALIGLSGSSAGVLGLYCSEGLARRMAGALLGDAPAEVTEEVRDAFGEIANIIAGSIASDLGELGEEIQLSLPSVIHGQSLVTSILNTIPPRRALRFRVDAEDLYVELALRQSED